MKKCYLMAILILFFAGINLAQIKNTITFKVDMSQMVASGFDPAADSIKVVGLSWDSFGIVLGDNHPSRTLVPGADNIYTATIELSCGTAAVGDSLRWKLYVWPGDRWSGNWEGGFGGYDGRAYYVLADGSSTTLDPVVPNFRALVTGLGPQNTFHIMADLTNIVGTGEGYFDPAVDGLRVEGFNWEGGIYISGSRDMKQNPLLPGVIYEATLVIELDTSYQVGDSLRWKFCANPGSRWANGGWEPLVGNFTVFQEDGATVEVGPFQPNISPLFTLKNDSKILFQVDLSKGATNRYDSSAIPIDAVQFVSLRGSHSVLGSWNGNWVPNDTINPGIPALHDDGFFGDKTANDNIWSRLVTFPAGTSGGQVAYKYGVYYPGCETISATYYMDGWGNTGADLLIDVLEGTEVVEVLDTWPNHTAVSVKRVDNNIPDVFSMDQNYPNPFNPSTTISYKITKAAEITLSIYSALGEKVMDLVNTYQNAGTYEVKFDAVKLSSGIYFYRLSDGSKIISKKMLLMK